MKKTAIFSDVVFLFAVISLPTLCLMRYYRYSLFVSAVVAVLLALAICALFLAFIHRKTGKLTLKKREEEEKNSLLFNLAMLGKKPLADLVLRVYEKKDERACLKKYGSTYAVSYEDFVCFPVFSVEDVSVEELEKICRIKTAKRKAILCNSLSDRAQALASKLSLFVLSGVEVYTLFKESGVSPVALFEKNPDDLKPRKKLKKALFRRNSRRFLACGAILLIASLLTPYSTYYILFGGGLTIAALLLRLFGLEETEA